MEGTFVDLKKPIIGLILFNVLLAFIPIIDVSGQPERRAFQPINFQGNEGIKLTALHSPQTSLDRVNEYDDPRSWGIFFREFNNGSLGTGIAVGDFDKDGRADIGIAYKTGVVRLYRNLGNNRFADVSEASGLELKKSLLDRTMAVFKSDDANEEPWTQGVSFADVDNDGWLDIYVCRFDAPNQLFINQKDGTFVEEAERRGLDLLDSSVMAAFCDYDRDGLLDVYLQTNLLRFSEQPDGRRDYLFRNTGDGFYADVSSSLDFRPETQGHSAIWWDYNGDRWLDLYVANDFAVPDILYRNNGDGTFSNVAADVLPLVPYSSMGCDIADVDGDGRMDLFVADMAATNRFTDQRTMAPARYAPIDKLAAKPLQRPRNCLFLATPSGYLREAAYAAGLDATDWTWSPRFEDLNNDGFEDLFVTNGMNREHHNLDLLRKVGRSRTPMARIALLKNSPVLNERDLLYQGGVGLAHREIGTSVGIQEAGVSFGSASGDFDNDGDLDFVVTRYNAPPLVYRNDSNNGKSVIIDLEGVESNSFGMGSILTLRTKSGSQTKQLSNARGYQSSSEAMVHFGLGNDDLVEELIVQWPSGILDTWSGLEAGFRYKFREGSSKHSVSYETTEAKPLFRSVKIERAREGSERSPLPMAGKRDDFLEPWTYDVDGPSLALVDVNDDGGIDVVLGDPTANAVSVVTDLAYSYTTANTQTLEIGSGSGPILVFDANEDGILDLLLSKQRSDLVKSEGGPNIELHLGDGNGDFKADTNKLGAGPAISAEVVAAADFNKDGSLDIFVSGRVPRSGDATSHRSGLLMREGGHWAMSASLQLPNDGEIGFVTSAVCSDVDLDGWVDLVLTTLWGSPRFIRNLSGEGFEDATDEWGFSTAGSGWWSSVAAADLNSDGRMDFVLGNSGLNTIYNASEEEPIEMLYGKFGDREKVAFLEYERIEGVRYPRRTLSDLVSVFPELRQRITSSNVYAELSLEQIFDPQSLEDAEVFKASELRCGVLLSGENGVYQFKPLPDIAQLGSTQGIALGDWNADTHVDIALAQNSSHAVSGPWYGGIGMILEGDGQGGFTELDSGHSGYVVPGEGYGLGTLDFDRNGWPDLLVTRREADPILFLNNEVEKSSSLSVSLYQSGSNPFAFGARIRAGYADGSSKVCEVYSNNGSSTQSEASVFFGYTENSEIDHIEVAWPDGILEQFDLETIKSGALRIEKGAPPVLWLKETRS